MTPTSVLQDELSYHEFMVKHFANLLANRWRCNSPVHEICINAGVSVHHKLRQEELDRWINELCLGKALVNQPPPWLLHSTNIQDNSSTTSSIYSHGSLNSSTQSVIGPGYYAGKALVRIGKPLWKATTNFIVKARFDSYFRQDRTFWWLVLHNRWGYLGSTRWYTDWRTCLYVIKSMIHHLRGNFGKDMLEYFCREYISINMPRQGLRFIFVALGATLSPSFLQQVTFQLETRLHAGCPSELRDVLIGSWKTHVTSWARYLLGFLPVLQYDRGFYKLPPHVTLNLALFSKQAAREWFGRLVHKRSKKKCVSNFHEYNRCRRAAQTSGGTDSSLVDWNEPVRLE
ncbi:hypothetical protein M422DRAFT_263023 [Sphaerobolus stellatus SS14]|uniref:Uncharacterized protein n=1 Tax=Sphaerobolus stellatus (strain SS14) TaxID=990650 RepID=A0A0C9VBH7_SPHS4|nr:hypothetical protein M422DRAFT_263023 [Sphaerobolus stellatus SS14]